MCSHKEKAILYRGCICNIVNWNKRIKIETVRRALFYNHDIYVYYKWLFSEVATEGTEDNTKTNSSGPVIGEDYFFFPLLRNIIDHKRRLIRNLLF